MVVLSTTTGNYETLSVFNIITICVIILPIQIFVTYLNTYFHIFLKEL